MKRLVIGLVIGLMIGMTGTAIAAQSDTVQAVFQKFNFIVNGQEQQLDADPLVYQGTTYLPVRVVANMLGYDVTYKASDQRIELISAVEQIENSERGENNMDQVIDLNGWIGARDLAETLYNLGGSLTVGPENITTLERSDEIQVKINTPTDSGMYEIINNPGSYINITIQGGLTYFNINELKHLGIID